MVKFYYNGIKDEKGEKLQKCHYSTGPYTKASGLPEGLITIYASDCKGFSKKVRAVLNVANESDSMTDLFCTDTIRVHPSSAHYNDVLDAYNKQKSKEIA